MKYQKNPNFEFLDIDDENLAIYDPESGDTHYVDETGKTIISYLDTPTDEESLVNTLCECYIGEKEEIAADVHTFLEELCSKGVVIQL